MAQNGFNSDINKHKNNLDVGTDKEKVLLEPFHYISQIPGKQIRTKLSKAFNYWLKIPDDKLLAIAEVTQMLHNASLLIDDIEDNSVLRRGIPVNTCDTFTSLRGILLVKDAQWPHHIYGIPHTINTANYVYFIALDKVQQLGHQDATKVFTEQLLELHRGQGMDIYWRDAYTCPTEEEYKRMVLQKTGGLFGLAVRLMQLFSQNKSNLKPLLDSLGLYFQIRDDFANLYSKEYEANKSYCEDLTEGKFSFPIVHAVQQFPEDNTVMSILRQRPTDNDVKKYCVEHMKNLGSFKFTQQVLVELEQKLLVQISEQGGNPMLEAVIGELRGLYMDPDI